jgi:WD40 repeat protein
VAVYGGISGIRAVSVNGSRILASDSEWKVIEPETRRVVSTLGAVDENVESAAFSPDGSVVATGSRDGTVRLFETATGINFFSSDPLGCSVLRIAFDGTGSRLAAGSTDGSVRLWNINSHTLLKVLPQKEPNSGSSVLVERTRNLPFDTGWGWNDLHNSHGVTAIAFSRSDRFLAVGFTDGHMEIWDLNADKFRFSVKGHSEMVLSISFNPDDWSFASAGHDGAVRIWNLRTGEEQAAMFDFSEHSVVAISNSGLNSVAYSPDGSQLFAGSGRDHIKIWNVRNCQGVEMMRAPGRRLQGIAFSPNGDYVVTGSLDGAAILWDLASGNLVHVFTGHQNSILSVAFSPDGKKIATASEDKTARIWEAQSGRELAVLTGHKSAINSIRFSPDGAKLATGSTDGTARIWDSQSGKQLLALSVPNSQIWSVAFSPDGSQIATGITLDKEHASDIAVRLWDAASGRNLKNFSCTELHTDYRLSNEKGNISGFVLSAAFSPDGKRIAASLPDLAAIGIWDVASGKPVATLNGQMAGSFAFSPDGARIISCPFFASLTISHNSDRAIRIWNAYSSELLYTLAGASNDAPVEEVAFSPDGARIASISSGNNSILKIWGSKSNYPPYSLLDVIRQINMLPVRSQLREDSIAYLKKNTKLDAGMRQAAISYLCRIPDYPETLNKNSYHVVKSPVSKPELYRQALRQAQVATREAPWEASYFLTLAIAQYRTGDYLVALNTLEKGIQGRPLAFYAMKKGEQAYPIVFYAMTLFKLGRVGEASLALEQLRSLIKNSSQAPDQDLQGFLREAEALIPGK